MADLVDDLRQQADSAIARMRTAATEARHAHARSDQMRHMLTTAQGMKDAPWPQAIDKVMSEWMHAWHLDRNEWDRIAALLDYDQDQSDDADRHLRESCASFDAALAQQLTSISDQIAWRSQCAHRWWELVVPTPADLPGAKPRLDVPALNTAAPFWASGSASRCV